MKVIIIINDGLLIVCDCLRPLTTRCTHSNSLIVLKENVLKYFCAWQSAFKRETEEGISSPLVLRIKCHSYNIT